MLNSEISTKTVNALMVTLITMKLIVLNVHPPVLPADLLQLVLHAMLEVTEDLKETFVFVSQDSMNSIMPINQEHAKDVTLNVLLALFLLLTVLAVTQLKTEFPESINMEIQHVSATQDSIQLKTDHASNLTVMLIHSALNANKDLNSVFNVLLPRTELLNFLKAFAFVWMDSIPTLIITVFLVQVDA